jgi:hypothetical protein
MNSAKSPQTRFKSRSLDLEKEQPFICRGEGLFAVSGMPLVATVT